MSKLEINDLQVSVDTEDGPKEILKGVTLTINEGETHAIMGPNGSGKSTLAYSVAGHPKYNITSGSVTLDGEDVLELLDPKVAVLDETDSGLDIDALKIVSEGVNRFKENGDKGVLLITHYTRILRYIKPDFVHVFVGGRIVEEGGPELAEKLEAEGYESYLGAGV